MSFPRDIRSTDAGSKSDIALANAQISYWANWLSRNEADTALARLRREVPFEQHVVRMFGRELKAPRLSAWIGDPEAVYCYSRVRYTPMPWTPLLSDLRNRLNAEIGAAFNSVLVNYYRDGRDSMGWHSDDEPELGPRPVIASISLGTTRRFKMKARDGSARAFVDLKHGSLLLMQGATQQNYLHAIDKVRNAGERINLTFRRVVSSASASRVAARRSNADADAAAP